MDLNLSGKTALVTGASYGLGFACAQSLAAEGVRVAIASRDRGRVYEAAERISTAANAPVIGIEADLTSDHDLERLATEARRGLGHVDILVLSTGHPPTYPFSQASDSHWEEGIHLILKPAIQLSRAFLPAMRASRYGRLIFIGSIFGLEPEKTSIVQSTLRTGLNAFSKCIATEAAPDGVTSNVICPGYLDTPLVRELAGKYASEEGRPAGAVLKDWQACSPSGKFGRPEDLGALVSFIASPRGEFINGTSLTMDGGALKQY